MSAVEVVDQARTRDLRRSVLRPGLGPHDPLPGDERPEAVHFGLFDAGGTPLCTCFVYPQTCPWRPDRDGAWHLRQMATDPAHRGEGLGAAVVAAAVDYIRAAGGALLWCDARETAVGFYAKLGFVAHGELFTDAAHPIPHLRMWRNLDTGPTTDEREGS